MILNEKEYEMLKDEVETMRHCFLTQKRNEEKTDGEYEYTEVLILGNSLFTIEVR